MNKKEPLQWHPAFYCAIRLALRKEEGLEYIDEYSLTDKPLQIDLMIVRKSRDNIIHNQIGKLFKGHNIIEYKSPDDKLNINTFYKSMAYACLYQSSPTHAKSINPNDITITLIRDRKPVKLIRELDSLGFMVTETEKGIYLVHNALFETQIIVSSLLDSLDNKWLKSLCRDMTQELYFNLYEDIHNNLNDEEKTLAEPVVQLVSIANKDRINTWREEYNMCQALKEIMRPDFEEDIKESFIKGQIKTYYECGVTPEDIAEKVECSLEYVNEVLGM